MDFQNLTVEELAKLISPSSGAYLELKRRKVLRTKNVVGELGEHYAIDFYNKTPGLPNLKIEDTGAKNIDAKSCNGEKYSIKTVTSRNRSTGSFWDPKSIENNEKKFDYLLIVILNNKLSKDMILELNWKDFFKHKKFNKRMNNYNISLTKKLINNVKTVYQRDEKKG